jgi:hypothetical protein
MYHIPLLPVELGLFQITQIAVVVLSLLIIFIINWTRIRSDLVHLRGPQSSSWLFGKSRASHSANGDVLF